MVQAIEKTKPAVRRLSGMRPIPLRRMRAGFDSAETSENNRRHWAHADGLSADAAASSSVRRTLRNRARYEVANNSYARGIVLTIANDTVGTGPRLQMLSDDAQLNRNIESDFQAWATAVGLAEKLRTMRMARCQDGECFAIIAQNPGVDHPIQIDLELVEADQVTSSLRASMNDREVDGVLLDGFGNPVKYRVLKQHPGAQSWGRFDDFAIVSASSMIHVFRQERPGQHRGIPEITPALPLFAQLRRFTLAVISAAEAAANFAGILYTDAPPNGETESIEPLDQIQLERNMLLTMPGGWKMAQVEPMQPATTYAEFKSQILNEIARCLSMPFNIAAGNSSGYNYASGRLDHQMYFKAIRVDQAFMAARILDRVLGVWLREYAVETQTRKLLGPVALHQWFWDGAEHVDPTKEANAQEIRLRNHTTTLAAEYARQGKDYEVELRQRAKEVSLMRKLGLPMAQENQPVGQLEPKDKGGDESADEQPAESDE